MPLHFPATGCSKRKNCAKAGRGLFGDESSPGGGLKIDPDCNRKIRVSRVKKPLTSPLNLRQFV